MNRIYKYDRTICSNLYLFRDNDPGADGNSGVSLIIFCTNSVPLEFVIKNSRPSGLADILVTIPRSPITN